MRKIAAGIAAASAVALAAGALAAPAATAADGTKSLAAVLDVSNAKFDKNSKDFDILTAAVNAVLASKSSSPVALLADGSVALTAFAPTDKAFRILAEDLTGKKISSEKKVFAAVAGLGIDTVETVLLYHVFAGATIDSKAAVAADGAWIPMAQKGALGVKVVDGQIRLRDRDGNSRNARVIAADINEGNKQIAHAIDRVLRPLDLPPTEK
jgi:uncharacterized surface protein with fasciclin (FAS1) repeats